MRKVPIVPNCSDHLLVDLLVLQLNDQGIVILVILLAGHVVDKSLFNDNARLLHQEQDV